MLQKQMNMYIIILRRLMARVVYIGKYWCVWRKQESSNKKPKVFWGCLPTYCYNKSVNKSIALVNMRSHKDSWNTKGMHQFISQVSTTSRLHQQKKMRFCSWYGKYEMSYYFLRKTVFTKSSKITIHTSPQKKKKKKN